MFRLYRKHRHNRGAGWANVCLFTLHHPAWMSTHPVLWIFIHIGHTASVLLEASQQLPQADRQQPQGQNVKDHRGEFHGSLVTPAPCYHRCSASMVELRLRYASYANTTNRLSLDVTGTHYRKHILRTATIGSLLSQWEEKSEKNGPIGKQWRNDVRNYVLENVYWTNDVIDWSLVSMSINICAICFVLIRSQIFQITSLSCFWTKNKSPNWTAFTILYIVWSWHLILHHKLVLPQTIWRRANPSKCTLNKLSRVILFSLSTWLPSVWCASLQRPFGP